MRRGKRKTCSRGDVDRLSELPDSLILEILSSLKMKDVVKTGILSKRWKNLWTRVYNLVYSFRVVETKGMSTEEYNVARELQLQQFVSFLNTTLRKHQSNIEMFSLSAFWVLDGKRVNALIDGWVKSIVEKKVQNLKLNFDGMINPYTLPDFLLQSSSLTKLKLEHLILEELSVPVKWNLLKSLCLNNIFLNDESMEKILLGCPVLQSLSLEWINGLERVNILSPSVRKLQVQDIGGLDNGYAIFRIRAPWVQELELSGRFIVAECQIEDVSSVFKATLTMTAYETKDWDDEDEELVNEEMEFNVMWIDMAPHVLKSLSHVAELSIGTELIQVLSLAKLYGKPSPTFQCKHMTIDSPLWNYDVLGISCLLENAPHLETLVINVSSYQWEQPFDQTKEIFDDDGVDLSLPAGKLAHLKNVKIDYGRNPCADNPEYVGGKCNDVEIVGYIMRSAVALERLVLCSSRPGCTRSVCSQVNCSFLYVPRLSSVLLTDFLPANEAEEWELKKRKYSYEYRFSNYASLSCEVTSKEDSS